MAIFFVCCHHLQINGLLIVPGRGEPVAKQQERCIYNDKSDSFCISASLLLYPYTADVTFVSAKAVSHLLMKTDLLSHFISVSAVLKSSQLYSTHYRALIPDFSFPLGELKSFCEL